MLERTFSHFEGYIPHGVQLHAVDRTLEYSRPLSALKLWLAFRTHGARAKACHPAQGWTIALP